jgi:hypothetical protein
MTKTMDRKLIAEDLGRCLHERAARRLRLESQVVGPRRAKTAAGAAATRRPDRASSLFPWGAAGR